MFPQVSAFLRKVRTRKAQDPECSVTADLSMDLLPAPFLQKACQPPMLLHVLAHLGDAATCKMNLVRRHESLWACVFLSVPMRERGSPGNTWNPIIDAYSHGFWTLSRWGERCGTLLPMRVSAGCRGVGRAQHLLQIHQIPTIPRGSRRYGASAGARKHAVARGSGATPRGGRLLREARKHRAA